MDACPANHEQHEGSHDRHGVADLQFVQGDQVEQQRTGDARHGCDKQTKQDQADEACPDAVEFSQHDAARFSPRCWPGCAVELAPAPIFFYLELVR